MESPEWQNHEYNPDLLIIREPGGVNHIAGDGQIKALKSSMLTTIVIPQDVKSSQAFFKIVRWPEELAAASLDIGRNAVYEFS